MRCEDTAGTVMKTETIRTYSDLIRIPTFEGRYKYLKLGGSVGEETFGSSRYINQKFYHLSNEWKHARDRVIVRDLGNDLGFDGYEIAGKIYVHHMNPITVEDIERQSPYLLDPEFLICVSYDTHLAIHFGNEELLKKEPIIRSAYDTCPWKR